MLSGITLGQYFPGQSLIHRLDPRTKILAILVLITSIFLVKTYYSYLALLTFTVGIIMLSTVPLRLVLSSIKPLWFILLITLLIHLFTTPGEVLMTVGPLTITDMGVRQGILMSFRLTLLIALSSILTFTTSPIVLTDGIERLLNPFKRLGVPAHELAMMMTIALRFIPTLIEETERIIKAQTARGAEFASGSLLKRAKNLIPLLVPLFISAFRRADELATAMEARCYRGGDNRTRMKALQLTMIDAIAALTIVLILCLLVWLR